VQMGLTALEGQSPQAIATRIKAQLGELSRTWETARNVTIRIEECTARLKGLRVQKAALDERIAAWEPFWADAGASLGLRPGATLMEARAALAVYERLPRDIETHAAAVRRLADLRATVDNFAGPALELAERLAPDLNGLSPDEAIGRLAERLRDARDALARREGAEGRLTEASIARLAATSVIEAAVARLVDLRWRIGLDDSADLVDVHARLSRLASITDQLQSARAELAEQASGETEADQAEAEKSELAETHRRLDEERLELHAAWRARIRERDTLEAGNGAEFAVQRRALAESEMAGLSREWLTLKLAATLVAKATARHRASHHVPLIERAGSLFAQITGGSFVGLSTEEDDAGLQHLAGLRPDGSVVEIGRAGSAGTEDKRPGGMSEGTLDQLYLAMRLAHLEEFARTAEPVPFIGDDLFMTFDDGRTGLGLEALAETADLIQPIIFTHHARVADIARARLGDAADVIEL